MRPSAPSPPDVGLAGLPSWKGASRYEILSCIGRGAMGVVYEAFDRQRGERVALKTLLHFDADAFYRFKQEFRTLADVGHPNLVQLYELVVADRDVPFFTMELVHGKGFVEFVRARGAASGPDYGLLRFAMLQLVAGVQALHDAGKLHRDLKPSNVRIMPQGRLVILDFGLATELRRRLDDEDDGVVGTAAYMPPEQATGDPIAAASDWYSVGVMLYEAMVGCPPFVGRTTDVIERKCTVEAPPPSKLVGGIPEDLAALCRDLLRIDPALRPAGAQILGRIGGRTSDRAAAFAFDRADARLVGREVELHALHEAFEVTREGRSVAARLSGRSGLGKSALVQHFLDELEPRDDVLVLRGRAYERESVPYKAVDSVIDAMTRHLIATERRGERVQLPDDLPALVHVFPVLGRVRKVQPSPQALAGDPQILRQHAFGALRTIFARLCCIRRVVVFVDDVQWGDTDSVALLVELLRPPNAPPLMLLTAHRSEEESASPFLTELRMRWPTETEVREIVVGPLDPANATRLALDRLGGGEIARKVAEEIAREAGGHPFLITELAQSANACGLFSAAPAASGPIRLEDVLATRIRSLPREACRLLEIVAIGGRPLPVTIADAAGIAESLRQLLATLRSHHFVHIGMRNGVEVVEPVHDRIRETIVAHLPAEIAREHHRDLARALEADPDSDPESLAQHLLGAGDKKRAAYYAERAGEQAVAKLAFAQAARLFKLTAETVDGEPAAAGQLHRRAAEAAEWAGLAQMAARSYLAAAAAVSPLERVDLERAAATQLIAAGCIDEGDAIIRRVLDAVGRPLPKSIFGILFWVRFYRIAAAVAAKQRRGEPKAMPDHERVRLDAMASASRALGVVDPVSAWYITARYLHDALRSGVRAHILHAAALDASSVASAGGSISPREKRLFEMARRIADESKSAEGLALYLITYGISLYLHGRWKEALAPLDVACKGLEAARRWNANANVYAVYALTYRGALREVGVRAQKLLADAERRGDLYTAVNLRASHPLAGWLARDEVAGARRNLDDSLGRWTKARYVVQHWQGTLWGAEIELYAGNSEAAWEKLAGGARSLQRSSLRRVQLVRVLTEYAAGRAALASAPQAPRYEGRRRLVRAKHAARRLERESVTWSAALAALLGAGLARQKGDASAAERWLRSAIERADRAGMSVHAAVARYRLGQLLGDDAQKLGGLEALRGCGIRMPDRYAQMLLPGPW